MEHRLDALDELIMHPPLCKSILFQFSHCFISFLSPSTQAQLLDTE